MSQPVSESVSESVGQWNKLNKIYYAEKERISRKKEHF